MHFFKKKSPSQPLSLQELKKNLKINFEPENARPLAHYKTFYMEHHPKGLSKISKRFMIKDGYVSDFLGTGEPGIVVHGSSEGHLVILDTNLGRDQKGSFFTPREFYRYLIRRYSLDLSKDKRPLHLVACYSGEAEKGSGKLSVAQELANATQRKIWAYGGHYPVATHYSGVAGLLNNTDYVFAGGFPPKRLTPKLIEPHPPVHMNKDNSVTHC
ncbi:Uncharacterised protein [Cedecea neteri]|uniref:Uncharacterized protein n=1 Tax=Cedecea neteri TaxID=158822 RepID=A0A2X3JF83_9ENTR|nr:hypothetical protein [Cedecea neteri]SQC93574.1 Uncharacterised protein [Cedecea neteri]